MSSIENLVHLNWIVIFLGFFALLFGIKEIIEILSYFKKKLRITTGIDDAKQAFEDRISKLEKHDNWQYEEIQKIANGIDAINNRLIDSEIDSMRWELLNFSSALSNGRKYNRESFEHIFRIYAKYEKILEDNHKENGVVEESMKYVRERFQELLHSGI